MTSTKTSYMGFTAGEEVFYNGLSVKLIKPVAEHEGHTWRVSNNDPEDHDFGVRFNIHPAHTHQLSRSATEDGIR